MKLISLRTLGLLTLISEKNSCNGSSLKFGFRYLCYAANFRLHLYICNNPGVFTVAIICNNGLQMTVPQSK